jgi:hypothetical protein
MTAVLAVAWTYARAWLSAAVIFLSTPPGSYLACCVIAGGAWWYSGHLGYERGQTACETAHKTAAVAEQARQAQVGADVTTASETRTGQSQAQDARNQEIVNDVKGRAHDLPPVPEICPPAVPAALADRLRKLE